jgi:hypothetical protein
MYAKCYPTGRSIGLPIDQIRRAIIEQGYIESTHVFICWGPAQCDSTLIWRILSGEGNASFISQKPYQDYFCSKQRGRNLSYSSLLPFNVFHIMKNMLNNRLTDLQLGPGLPRILWYRGCTFTSRLWRLPRLIGHCVRCCDVKKQLPIKSRYVGENITQSLSAEGRWRRLETVNTRRLCSDYLELLASKVYPGTLHTLMNQTALKPRDVETIQDNV